MNYEPNRFKMIPLYVCDQAVAACDAEILRLKADLAKSDAAVWDLSVENTQLKTDVKRLIKAGDAMEEQCLAIRWFLKVQNPDAYFALVPVIQKWDRDKWSEIK